ncbi:fatty acid desaturase family protein [Crocosphaera sp. XPORK-15E]|uniref:fatty acid desaturase family protein n=1 Tax=Crocosphaera sp. XPORK-15E TaxID=3110247 RepID=UPI002B20445B|nr:fatty acid desaturase [Crocosphaera sp. XPORK-15E]MEA5532397.1 fatty acid desaturase [Crocosphaera sp. XPORK-15E]
MQFTNSQALIPQGTYAKKLRPLLPAEAFLPDPTKLVILFINLTILVLGWMIASHLDSWSIYLLWLYLPIAIIMGNSVMSLAVSCHDLMHGTVIRNSRLIHWITLLGLTMLWMPPTLWKVVHNRVHHNKTNSLDDPDRNYLYEQPNTWSKWFYHQFLPSFDVNPIRLVVGMGTVWGYYAFRNLTSVLFFNGQSVDYLPASFRVSAKERWAIAGEFFVMLMIHLSILVYLQFDPLKLILSYFLPIGIGYAVLIFYIYTHHLISPMTSVNDPLLNSVSIRVPKIVDLLHLNFSYHTEHHIFPGMNSDYYPMVQELLKIHYPDRFNLLSAGEAWHLLLTTPRSYKDENTLTDWSGKMSVPCPVKMPNDKESVKTSSSMTVEI